MNLFTKTYYGEPGLDYVQDSNLSYVTILQVSRSGQVHSVVGATPVSLQCTYADAIGKVSFDSLNPFNGPTGDRPNRSLLEKIIVLYKT